MVPRLSKSHNHKEMTSLRPVENRHDSTKLIEGWYEKIAKTNTWKVGWLHLTKKIGEWFHPPFPTPTTVVRERVSYGICFRFYYLSSLKTGGLARMLTTIILKMMYLAIAVLLTISHLKKAVDYLLISLSRKSQGQFSFTVNASMITSHKATIAHIGK